MALRAATRHIALLALSVSKVGVTQRLGFDRLSPNGLMVDG